MQTMTTNAPMGLRKRLVATINNEGIELLKTGDLNGSLLFFQQALEEARKLLHDEESSPSKEAGRDSKSSVQHGPAALLPGGIRADCSAYSELPSAQYIHAQAISIVPKKGVYASDELEDSMIVISLVIFNIALVHHLKGLAGSNASCEAHLLRACSLYRKAYSLVIVVGMDPLISLGRAILDFLMMAILNNFGQASHQLFYYEAANICFEQLIAFSGTINPIAQYEDDEGTASVLHWFRYFFVLNAFTLRQSPKLSPAA